ncbi:MAG: hypothetical protein IIX44_06115 [Clostridia bacterium]|nr:hypothetical protein [Clostridia bacterium]
MNKNVKPVAPRALYQQKFTSARYNLLLVIGMTLINIVMLFLGGSSYFLFSATIPYSLSIDGAYYTGKLPEEFYTDMPADAQFFPDSYLAIMLGIAIAILAVYFLCFMLSKKFKTGWMITAAVMFVLDTLYMLFIYGVGVDSVMDILLHAWVLYYLISGVVYGLKLKKLPEDEPAPVDGEGVEIEIPTQTNDKAE